MILHLIFYFIIFQLLILIICIYKDFLKYNISYELFLQRFICNIEKSKEVLLYGVSAGEVRVLKNFVKLFNCQIMCHTPTGFKLINRYNNSSLKPYDNIISTGLFFYKLRPKLVIIGENDIWLFFYLYCKIFRIPIILVNYNYNKYGKTYNKIRNFYYQSLATEIFDTKKLGNMKLLNVSENVEVKKNKVFLIASAGKDEIEIHLKIMKFLLENKWTVIYVPRHLNWLYEFKKYISDMDYVFTRDLIYNNRINVIWKFGILKDIFKLSQITLAGDTFNSVGGHNIVDIIFNKNYLISGPNYRTCSDLMNLVKYKSIAANYEEFVNIFNNLIDLDIKIEQNLILVKKKQLQIKDNINKLVDYIKIKYKIS